MKLFSISLVWLLLLCGDVALGQTQLPDQVSRDDSRWKGTWTIGTPERHGFDAVELDRIADQIGRMPGVYSFLLVSGGDLVVERYYRQGSREKPHNLKSASKSLISILTGIAIDKGFIRLDQPISELLAEVRAEGAAKGAITVEHLLAMTSGLETTSYGGYNRWIASDNWVKAALELPLVAEPGTFYQYSTGNTHLLSAVITAASGTSTLEFANRYLFEPMDIEIYDWQLDPQGIHIGGNNLLMTPRDMAKIGLLFLDGGRWGDRQLVSRQWVERSTRSSELGEHAVYGTHSNLWWTDTEGGDFAAVGFGGQYIYVSPADDSVIVVTSTLYSKGDDWTAQLFELLRRDVLKRPEAPAIRFAARDEEIEPSAETLALRRALAQARDELAEIVRQLGEDVAGPPRFETTARVNFRSGPNQTAALLGLLEPGVPVSVVSRKGKWFEVRVGGRLGWLYADYVGPAAIAPDLGPEIAGLRRALARTESDRTDTEVPATSAGPVVTTTTGSAEELTSERAARLQLADDLARQREMMNRVRVQLEAAAIERQSLMQSLSDRQRQLDDAQARVSALERSLRETRTDNGAQDESASLRRSLAEREGKISDMTDALTSAAERIAALRLEAQSNGDALRRTLAEKQVIENTLEQDRRKIALLQGSLETANEKLDAAETDLAAAKTMAATQVLELRSERQNNDEAFQAALTGNQAVKADLEQMRLKVGLLEQALELSNTKLSTAESELSTAVTATAALQSDTQAKDEALQQALLDKQAIEGTLEQRRQQVTQLQDALGVLNSKLIGSQRELIQAQETAAALNLEMQSNSDGLQQASIDRQTIESALEQERQRSAALQQQLETATKQLGAAENELAEAQTTVVQLAALQTQMRSKDETLQQALADRQVIETALEQERQRIATLQQQLETSNSRLGAVETNLDEAVTGSAAQLAALQSQIQSKDETLQQALADRQDIETALEQERRRIAALQQQLETSNARLGAAETNLNETVADSAAQLAALQSQIQSKNETLQQATSNEQTTEAALKQNRQQVTQLQGALDALNARFIASREEQNEAQVTAAAQLAALQREGQAKDGALEQASTDLQASEATLEQQRQRIAALQQQLETSNSKLSTVESSLADANATAAAQLAALQREGQAKDDALEQASTNLQASEATLEQQHQRIAALQQQLETSNSKLSTVESSLADANATAAAQLAALQREGQAKDDALEQASTNLQASEATLEQQHQRIAALQQQLETSNEKLGAVENNLAEANEAAAGRIAALQSDAAQNAETLQQVLADKQSLEITLERQGENYTSLAGALAQLHAMLEESQADLQVSRGEQKTTAGRAEALETTKAVLEQELETQALSAAESEAERVRLVDRLAILDTEHAALRGQLEQSQMQVADLEKARQLDAAERDTAQAESLKLQKSLTARQAALEAEIASGQAAAMRAASAQRKSADALAALQSELAQNTEALNGALAARDELEGSLRQERERTSLLEQSLAQAIDREQTTRGELTGQLDQIGAELESSREALQRANTGNSEAAAELARLLQEAETASKALAGVEEALARQRQTTGIAEQRIVELETAIDANQKAFESRDAAKDTEIAAALERESALRDSLDSANTRRDELSKDLQETQSLAQASANRVSELETAMARLQTRLDTQDNELTALDGQRSLLADQLSAATAEAARQRDELDGAVSALAQSRAVLATVRDENQSQLTELTNLTGELQKSRANESALQDRLDVALTENGELETALAGSRRNAGQAQQSLATALSEAGTLRNQLDVAGNDIAELELAIEQSQQVANERDEARSQVETLQGAVVALQGALAGNRVELSDQGVDDDSLVQLRQRVTSLEESLTQATRREDETRTALTAQIDRLGAELELARETLQQVNRERDDSVAALAELRQQTAVTAAAAATAATAMPGIETQPVEQVSAGSSRAAVEETVRRWAQAWSDQDVPSYLATYADNFVPPGNLTLAGWQNQRRSRVGGPQFIEVSIDDLDIEVTGDAAVASFMQSYRSNTYSDRTRKELQFRFTSGSWRIVRERSR